VESEFFAEFKHPSGKDMKLVNSFAKFSETPASIRGAAPEFGQHTEEVILELGYNWEDIANLKEQGVIP
jgi:crotonobetainyl-CoA:carnitine CoA-transferase CaiB-like acyl-CoA transferase